MKCEYREMDVLCMPHETDQTLNLPEFSRRCKLLLLCKAKKVVSVHLKSKHLLYA